MKVNVSDKDVIVYVTGKIDSGNSVELGKELLEIAEKNKDKPLILDCSKLIYISSAGLRVLLKIKKLSAYEPHSEKKCRSGNEISGYDS